MHLEIQGEVAGSRTLLLPIDGKTVARAWHQGGSQSRDVAGEYLKQRKSDWAELMCKVKWSAMYVPKIHCWLLARHTRMTTSCSIANQYWEGIVRTPPEAVSRGGPELRENRHCWMAACVVERCEPCEFVHDRFRALLLECFSLDGIELQFDCTGPGHVGKGQDGVLKLLDITDATGREYL